MLKLYNLDNQFIEEVKTMPENFTGIIENSHKTKIWYKNGKCHRIDGPAIVFYKIKDDDWYTPEDVFYRHLPFLSCRF